MKRLILAFGVMGLVGCFVPMFYDYDGPDTWSWWQLRHDFPVAVYVVIAAYAVATWIGLQGRHIGRAHAIVATLAFGVVAYVLWPPIPVFVLAGWYLMVLSAFGGSAISLAVVLAGNDHDDDATEPV